MSHFDCTFRAKSSSPRLPYLAVRLAYGLHFSSQTALIKMAQETDIKGVK